MIMSGYVPLGAWERDGQGQTDISSSFLIFPSAFDNNADLAVDQSTASVAAIVLLALGYTVSVALWFICTSWLFQLDVIFL